PSGAAGQAGRRPRTAPRQIPGPGHGSPASGGFPRPNRTPGSARLIVATKSGYASLRRSRTSWPTCAVETVPELRDADQQQSDDHYWTEVHEARVEWMLDLREERVVEIGNQVRDAGDQYDCPAHTT